ncbi:MAG: beta strand repeat-containing protein [Panacagrimonas sp.]
MRTQSTWGRAVLFAITTLLVACGGGNPGFVGDDGTGGGGPGPTPTPTRTPAFLFLNSSSAQLANDADQSSEGVTITAIVTDASGNVVPDVAVAFAIAPGSGALAPAGTVTDASGSLSAILTTGTNPTLRTISVTGSVSGLPVQSVTVQVVNSGTPPPVATPASLRLVASTTQLSSDADTAAEGSSLTAFVTTAQGTLVSDVSVQFSVLPVVGFRPGALQVTRGTTNATGSAAAILTTGGNSASGAIRVEARIVTPGGVIAQTLDVQIVNAVSSIELLTAGSELAADADTSAEGVGLTAIVRDSQGNLLPGISVSFNGGTGAVAATRLVTDDTGTATGVLTTGGNPTLRTLAVTAAAGGLTSNTVVIDVVSTVPAPSRTVTAIRLFSTSASLFDDADTQAEGLSITAVATNAQGNTVPGVPVSFSLVAPNNVGALQVTANPTSANGVASAQLTTGGVTTPRTITVQVSVDTGASTLTAAADVQVVRRINSLSLLVSSPQLLSNADEAANGVIVTAVVRDANQNAVPNVAVSFATADSADILVSNPALTDTNGRAQAIVTTGGDPANRAIHITATAASITDSVRIAVIGTTLIIQGPANTQIGVPARYTITLSNREGGIAGQTVTVATEPGNTLSATSLTTDATGQATVTLTPTVADSSLTATSLGLSATRAVTVSIDQFRFVLPVITPPGAAAIVPINTPQRLRVRWLQGGVPVPDGTLVGFVATRGVLSAVQAATVGGVASVSIASGSAGPGTVSATTTALTMPNASIELQFVATQAFALSLEAEPVVLNTTRTSAITASVLDDENNVVAGKTVEFSLVDNSGGSLSAPTAVTDGFGRARITFRPGAGPSAANGVVVTGVARNADGTVATGQTTLTVTDGALRLSLQTGNEIKEPSLTTYEFPYVAIVTDAAGNPAPGASFQLSALPTVYFKGYYILGSSGFETVATAACPNEDQNRNGILDPGEDINGNGILEPGNVATVPSSPRLGDNGTVQFDITYGQDRGNWIQLLLTGRASVDGTEDREQASFILPISIDDANGPESPPGTQYDEAERGIDVDGDGDMTSRFVGSPYGVSGSCSDSR